MNLISTIRQSKQPDAAASYLSLLQWVIPVLKQHCCCAVEHHVEPYLTIKQHVTPAIIKIGLISLGGYCFARSCPPTTLSAVGGVDPF
jgi:hypothetical protein